MTPVRHESAAPGSRVKHSTTEPPRFHNEKVTNSQLDITNESMEGDCTHNPEDGIIRTCKTLN